MPKQLPKVFVNKIDKQIKNNRDLFYSKTNNEREQKLGSNVVEEIVHTEEYIKNKIIKLFDSPNFVYKLDVVITTKDNQVLEKKLIAMVNDTILTLEEDKISVSNIKDIKEKTT